MTEHCKSHHFCVDVTDEIAKTWQAEFAIAEDLGEKRIHYVRNNAMATQFVFDAPVLQPFNVPNFGQAGPTDIEVQSSLPTVPTASAIEPADVFQDNEANDEEMVDGGDWDTANDGDTGTLTAGRWALQAPTWIRTTKDGVLRRVS